jgi:hypothetical protein
MKEGCKTMSHHFDIPTAKADPRIHVCDLYILEGSPGATVMARTVNQDADLWTGLAQKVKTSELRPTSYPREGSVLVAFF